jgi:hypothetical protein
MADPTISEMARAVATALEDESRWCTGAFARDASGLPVTDSSPKACAFCAEGHARRLFPFDYFRLSLAYSAHGGLGVLHDDNDRRDRGRTYVRDRLLELAEVVDA